MRINAIRTRSVRVPLSVPAKWSGGTRETASAILVEIHTDEGLVGYGEGVGPTLPTIQTIIDRELTPLLLGADPRRMEFLLHKMEEQVVNWSELGRYAIAAVEMALWDLKGKWLNASVTDLLGGIYREAVDYIGYLFIEPPDINAQQAMEYVRQGFRTLKVKVGRDPTLDVERIKAIRQAVGPNIKIRVDANMAWNPTTAIKVLRQMEPFDIQYAEQPVPWYDLDGMARVRNSVAIPIAADESCTGFQEALALVQHQACDVFVVYVSEAGGLIRAQQIVRLAEEVGIACVLGTWAELGIGTIAGLHLIASSRNFPFANDTHYPMMQDDILSPMLMFQDGQLRVPEGPGLGVVPDPQKVERFAQWEARETVFGDPDDPKFIPRIGQIL